MTAPLAASRPCVSHRSTKPLVSVTPSVVPAEVITQPVSCGGTHGGHVLRGFVIGCPLATTTPPPSGVGWIVNGLSTVGSGGSCATIGCAGSNTSKDRLVISEPTHLPSAM